MSAVGRSVVLAVCRMARTRVSQVATSWPTYCTSRPVTTLPSVPSEPATPVPVLALPVPCSADAAVPAKERYTRSTTPPPPPPPPPQLVPPATPPLPPRQVIVPLF